MTTLRPTPLRWTPTPIAAALALLVAGAQAQTLPTQPNVVRGSATFSRPGAGQLNVQQSTQNAVINWQTFSIGANGKVVFQQPNAQSVALNRVTGGEASTILGSLSANGRVFLVNPSGVLFGAGASVNVGGLVASTLDIGDDDFAAGRYRFTRGAAAPASVVNEGRLQAAPGGTIALVGSSVRNDGTIEAPQGTAALASGKTVTLDFQGDGLTQLRVTEADVQALAANGGTLAADGGRVLMLADATQASGFVVNQSGIVRARSLTNAPGGVVLSGGGGDVSVTGTVDAAGGSIVASGRNVGVLGSGQLDAAGGQVTLGATATAAGGGVVAIAPDALVRVDGSGSGSGGRIELNGSSVRANGSLAARGGADGGDGGTIKFNVSGGVDTLGLRADASAPRGKAGMLNIDPFDVTIADDSGLPITPPALNPFVPVAASFVGTRAINAALNAGTDVTITTGTANDGGTGGSILFGLTQPISIPFGAGSINFATTVTISRTASNNTATLRFDAARDITTVGPTTITSTAGPLNVDFDSNALGLADGRIFLNNLAIQTNGGAVRLFGQGNPDLPSVSSNTGVTISNSAIVTNGGAITMRGVTPLTQLGNGRVGLTIDNSTLSSGAGAITLDGRFDPNAQQGDGLSISSSSITSTSGTIAITGIGQSNSAPTTAAAPWLFGTGVSINDSRVTSDTGTIDIRGLGAVAANSTGTISTGVQLIGTSTVASTGGGTVLVSGSSGDASTGVYISPIDTSEGVIPPSTVNGGNVVIRASNASATTSAVTLGSVVATGVVNVRPGQVDANGGVSDRSDVPVTLNGSAGVGLAASDLAAISAPTLVLGSSGFDGTINVFAPTTYTGNLTLQTGTFGNIALNAPIDVGTGTLALATGSFLFQSSGATINAGSLLVRSGGAALTERTNSVGTLAVVIDASTLEMQNSRALSLGPVAARGFDPNANVSTTLDARSLTYLPPVATIDGAPARPGRQGTSIAPGTMLVQTSAGPMTLDGDIVATALDLVTPATFQNIANSTITAPNGWRLWADTWVGENRGGLQGTPPTPNLYGCTFGISCGEITIPTSGATFIYTQRPALTITANNLTRGPGDPNPPLTYTVTGLVNGDTAGNAVSGAPSTTAVPASPIGSYPISTAGMNSPVGYVVTTVDGTLTVAGVTPTQRAQAIASREIGAGAIEPRRDGQSTYVYDRNLGLPQMCVPDTPLDAEPNHQTLKDLLAVEWSRLRSRPNISNCFDSGRRNGCGDF
jgi:filamentous hemagglutinin family protein